MKGLTPLACLLLSGLLVGSTGCGNVRPCREGTVFLLISFDGAAAEADRYRVTLTIGETTSQFERAHSPGGTSSSVEVAFSAYPINETLVAYAEAFKQDALIGSGSQAATLASGCSAVNVTIAGREIQDGGGDAWGADLDGGSSVGDLPAADAAPTEDGPSADFAMPSGDGSTDLVSLPDLKPSLDLAFNFSCQDGGGGSPTLQLLAGKIGTSGWADGTSAYFNSPGRLAFDGQGYLYVADTGNHAIRKVDLTAFPVVVTTVAGSIGVKGSADGPAQTARFNAPFGLAIAGGYLYVVDSGNSTIRKIDLGSGQVTTLAGQAGVVGSTNGTGTNARFKFPKGIAADSSFLYVADTGNYTIRKVALADGQVTTWAGTAGSSGTVNGQGTAARFCGPMGLALDNTGNLFIADYGCCNVREISPSGAVTTVASTVSSFCWSDDPQPYDIYFDRTTGTLYELDVANWFSGTSTTVREVTTGMPPALVTIANFTFGMSLGLAGDGAGSLYFAATANHTVKKLNLQTTGVATIAGSPGSIGTIDGRGNDARLTGPTGMTVGLDGNLYVADTEANTLRKITFDGTVSTIAGSFLRAGTTDGTGANALFNGPVGLSLGPSGDLLVADVRNNRLRSLVVSSQAVTRYAGLGPGSADGPALTMATFRGPNGVAFDGTNLYVADTGNHTIRMIDPAQNVTTLAGVAGAADSIDGIPGRFSSPTGLTLDPVAHRLYVADTNNHTIRDIDLAPGPTFGRVSTIAGMPITPGKDDGPALGKALFSSPSSVAWDAPRGILYVADYGNSTVRRILQGNVTTWVGVAGSPGLILGSLPGRLNRPAAVAIPACGLLAITDAAENVVLVVQ